MQAYGRIMHHRVMSMLNGNVKRESRHSFICLGIDNASKSWQSSGKEEETTTTHYYMNRNNVQLIGQCIGRANKTLSRIDTIITMAGITRRQNRYSRKNKVCETWGSYRNYCFRSFVVCELISYETCKYTMCFPRRKCSIGV